MATSTLNPLRVGRCCHCPSSLQLSSPSIVRLGFRHRAPSLRLPSTPVSAQTSRSSLTSPSEETSTIEHKACFKARASQSLLIEEAQRPLAEYMSLPASQYSVLDAERIERIDENTFRCYVYRLKFFNFEVCPVLLVRVEEQPDGCCIRLLSCTLEGSPLVVAQNKKFSGTSLFSGLSCFLNKYSLSLDIFSASMVNKVSWSYSSQSATSRRLNSDAMIEVVIEVPFAFRFLPVEMIEGTGTQALSQVLKAMLPRFLSQLQKDYLAWASGDSSRQPLGTGEL
ncbi:hypothetical protein L7F22_010469 [Adiantum nelumboides]|nr:hypothetical protein [Adiantum nelumboides]